MNKFTIRIKQLFIDPSVGKNGYVGIITVDDEVLPLCSREKWNLGPNDSLRKGWINNKKSFPKGKTIHVDGPIEEFRKSNIILTNPVV